MGDGDRDFFRALRKKIHEEPGPDFDRRFWAKFEQEFGEKRKPADVTRPGFLAQLFDVSSWNLGVALPMAATLLIVAGGTFMTLRDGGMDPARGRMVAEIMENEELLDDLDFYANMELSDISDEEFDLILKSVEEEG